MNTSLFLRSATLSALLAITAVEASSVTYQKEGITENNLPVFYSQFKKANDIPKFMVGRTIYRLHAMEE